MRNLTDFEYNSFTSDSQMLNTAVTLAKESGTLVIPPINPRTGNAVYFIDESILLPSDFTVILDNCHLKLTDDAVCNIFRNENLYADGYLTVMGEQKNIKIIGKGHPVLDAAGHNDIFEWSSEKDGRPSVYVNNLILMHNVDGFEVSGIEIKDQRWWGMNFLFCSNGTVSDITVRTDSRFSNQDGINLRVGCHHIKLERISGVSGDDFIALSAIGYPKKYLVSGKSSDIAYVEIKDIIASSMHEGIITLRANDGHKIHHISIENIIESNYGNENVLPYTTVLLNQAAFFDKEAGRHGSMHHINVKNIYTKSGGAAITVGNTLLDSTVENIYASGCINAITTLNYDHYGPTRIVKRGDSDDPNFPEDGISLERVIFKNIVADDTLKGAVIDFTSMRPDDFIKESFAQSVTYPKDVQAPAFSEGKEIPIIDA